MKKKHGNNKNKTIKTKDVLKSVRFVPQISTTSKMFVDKKRKSQARRKLNKIEYDDITFVENFEGFDGFD